MPDTAPDRDPAPDAANELAFVYQALLHAQRQLAQGRLAEAVQVLLALESEYLQVADADARFLLYRLLGQAARTEGRLDAAVSYYRTCLAAAPDERMRSAALEGLALTASAQRRPKQAFGLFEEAARAALAAGDTVGHATVLQNHALTATRHGLDGAEDLLRRALEVAELPETLRGVVSDNLAVELSRQGRYDEAARHAEEAAGLLDAAGAHHDAYKAWMNLADIHRRAGRKDDCGAAFTRAHDLGVRLNAQVDEEHYGPLYDERVARIEARTSAVVRERFAAGPEDGPASVSDADIALDIGLSALDGNNLLAAAEARCEAGDLAGAEALLLRAESQWEHLQAVHCLAPVWNLLGLVLVYAGAAERAHKVLSRSRNLSHALGDALRESIALTHLAMVENRFDIGEEDRLGLLLRARALHRVWMLRRLGPAASAVPEDVIDAGDGVIEGTLAQLCADYDAWDLADAYGERSLRAAGRADGPHQYRLALRLAIRLRTLRRSGRTEAATETLERLTALGDQRSDPQTVLAAYAEAGRHRFAAKERGQDLLDLLVAACDAYEEVRRQALDLGPLPDFHTFTTPPYGEAVEVALAVGGVAQAFALAERAKTRSLLDAVRHDAVGPATDDSLLREHELWGRQRELRGELSARHEAEEADERVRRLIRVEEQLDEVRRELAELWDRLAPTHPEVRGHRMAEPITSPEAARLLDRSGASALVEFWTGHESLYAFVVEPGRTEPRLVTLGSHEALGLDRTTGDVRALLTPRSYGDRQRALGAVLCGPLHAALRSVVEGVADAGSSVLVVPHGPLHGVPLHLSPDTTGRRPGPALRYLPSASLLRSGGGAWHRDGAVVVGGHPGDGRGEDGAELAYCRSECAEVAVRMGGTAQVGDTATGDWLAEAVGSADRLSLVHLACHATFDERRPERSGLKLAGAAGKQTVTVRQLAAMDWSGALVTLSACGSGRHRVRQGDELVGLGHALLSAGARGLVVSQWPVLDHETAVLMSLFYEALAAEPAWDAGVVAAALSRAQRRMAAMTAADLVDWACTRLESPHRAPDTDRLSRDMLRLAHAVAGTPEANRGPAQATPAEEPSDCDGHRHLATTRDTYRLRAFADSAAWGAFVFYGA